MPLIVNHGWPGSIIEQLKLIEPRPTDRAARAQPTRSMWWCRRCRATGSRETDQHQLGPRAHGQGLGGTDGPPRLQPLRRPRRRLGCVRRRPDGRAGTGRSCSASATCRPPFPPTSTRPWPASRRHRVSPPRATRLRATAQDVQAGRVRQVHGGATANVGIADSPVGLAALASGPQRCRQPANGGRRNPGPDHQR